MSLSRRKWIKYLIIGICIGMILLLSIMVFLYNRPERKKNRHYTRSRIYLQQKKFAKAIVELKLALALDPKATHIRFYLAKAYGESEAFEQAEEEAQKILAEDRSQKEVYLFLINIYLQEKKYQDALSVCDSLLQIDPLSLDAFNQRGIVLWKMGYKKQAENEFQKAIAREKKEAKSYLNLARLYWDMNRSTDATLVLINYLQDEDSKNVSIRLELANYYVGLKEYSKAVKKFEEILADDTSVLSKLAPGYALSLLYTGKTQKALSLAEDMLKGSREEDGREKEPLLVYVRGMGRLERKDYENAINDFLWISRNHTDIADIHYQLGRAYQGLEKNRLAIQELSRAVVIYPASTAARQLLIQILIQEKDWDKALEHCEALTLQMPENLETLKWKAVILTEKGETEKAKQIFQGMEKSSSDSIDGKLGLAIVDSKQGKYDEAIQKLLSLQSQQPEDYYLCYLLGQNYFAKKDLENAFKFTQLSLAKNPSFAASRLLLAQLRLFLGDHERALIEYQKLHQQMPEDEKLILDIGNLYLTMGQSEKAFQFLQKTEQEKTKTPPFLMLLAKIYLAREDLTNALQCLMQISSKDPKIYLLMGDIHTRMGNYKLAIQTYDLAERVAENYAPYLHIAICYYLQNGYEEAHYYIQQYLEKQKENELAQLLGAVISLGTPSLLQKEKPYEKPSFVSAQSAYAWIESLLQMDFWTYEEKFDKALFQAQNFQDNETITSKDLIKIIHFCKEAKTHFSSLLGAIILREMGNFHAASIKCKEALQVLSSQSSVLYIYGDILHRFRHEEEAIEIFQSILSKGDATFLPYAHLGKIYFQRQQWSEAEKLLLQALQLHSKLSETSLFLGMIYAYRGDIEKAIVYHEKARKTAAKGQANLGQIYNNLAWLYLERKNPDVPKALECAEKAMERLPYDGSVADTLGWTYFHSKRYGDALKYLTYATNLYVDQPTIHYHLGEVYLQLGNKAKALAALEKALSISPHFPEAARAQKILQELKKQ